MKIHWNLEIGIWCFQTLSGEYRNHRFISAGIIRRESEKTGWTNPSGFVSLRAMAQPESKLVTPASLAVDAVLVTAFFLYLYSLVSTHVPSRDPKMILLWGGLCSACMSAVFWLCIQMFRVVLRAQRERK